MICASCGRDVVVTVVLDHRIHLCRKCFVPEPATTRPTGKKR
jgi:hypothetical protein